jgi:hypothetical protein
MMSLTSKLVHAFAVVSLFILAIAVTASPSGATPITASFVVEDTDWTSGAVGGIGGGNGIGGSGSITIAGVTGPVTKAYLYWHGIDNNALRTAATQPGEESKGMGGTKAESVAGTPGGCDGVYNSPGILLDGVPVNGISLGDATTNCWGDGSSRAFRADVTSLVAGNGSYTLSSMTTDACDDVNGASLIVAFDDGNVANNRDLVFFEGNDSNIAQGFPGETDGWHGILNGIAYTSGSAAIQLHLGDGQNFTVSGMDDNSLTIAAGGPAVVIPDGLNIYDGASTADAGFSRSVAAGTPGTLWDVHTFDISGVFTGPGNYNLTLDGQDPNNDCTGLVLAIIDLVAGQAPVPAQATSWGKLKVNSR